MSGYNYYGDDRRHPHHVRYKKPYYEPQASVDSDDGYYSDNYYRPDNRRSKSIADRVKEFGEDVGVGGAVAAITGPCGRSRSRSKHRSNPHRGGRARSYDDGFYDDDRHSRSRGRSRSNKKWKEAAKAAAVAGVIEAYRSRNDPGEWTGARGTRVVTAALTAAGVDSFRDKDPDKHRKRHTAEAALVGLIGSRIASGHHPRF